MTVIHDQKGNAVTEFPEVSGKRVVPVKVESMPALSESDNAIGAVELKDATSDTRATISDQGLEVNIKQDVVADDNNSSTFNLNSGNSYTFTGTSTSTLGVAGIQVSLYADKNCHINVQQSPDEIHWDLNDEYYYTASGNFGITVQAISSYVRVIVDTNNETTTVFRLQTALCPIVEAVPRSLDGNGNFKIATPMDAYGFEAENTPMGEARVAEPSRLIGTGFEGTTIDSRFWTTAATGTAATIAQANAEIVLTSGTSNGATVTMYSNRRARYVSGSGMRYRAVVQASAGVTNNKRRWGIGFGATMPTVTDGAWFQLNGTEFSINTKRNNAADVKVTSFNGQLGASYTPGTSVATYEIYWTNSKVWFVIGGKILHTVSASTATWASTMQFHIFADSVNAGVIGASETLQIRTNSIYRLGKMTTQPISYYHALGTTTGVILKTGGGNLHGMVFGAAVNNSVITIYDGTSTAGTIIWLSTISNASSMPMSIDFKGLPFYNGLFFVVATQNASFAIIYE